MKYREAKRILTTKLPNLLSRSSIKEANRHRATVYWVVTEREQANECVELLNNYTWPSNYADDNTPFSKSITDPKTHQDVLSGEWRHVNAIYTEEDGEHRVVLVIEAEINIAAPITAANTSWRIINGTNFKSGSRNIVLELANCDPAKIQSMADENTDAVYNSAIYTTNGGVLSGKWYRVDTIVQIDEETGWGKLLWFLRNHDNEDLGFVYLANKRERHMQFFKLRLPPDGIDDFKSNYYFDSNGDFYVSTDGVNYTAKNGDSAMGGLPSTAKTLIADADGRTVPTYNVSPDEKSGEVNVHCKLVFRIDSGAEGSITNPDFDTIETALELVDVDEAGKDDFLAHTYIGTDGSWYYAADDANYTRKNGEDTAATALPADANGLSVQVEGRTQRVRTSFNGRNKTWTVNVTASHSSSDTRISSLGAGKYSFKRNKDVQVYHDEGFNISKADLDTLKVYYNGAIIAGTARTFEFQRLPNGNYNYTGVEIMRTGHQTSFTLGTRTYHLGNHMALPPSTDPLADPAQYTVVAATGVVSDVASYNDNDGTWSWRIVSQSDESYEGIDDPLGGKRALVEYGTPEKRIRLCKREVSSTKPNNGLPDVGYYELIYVDDGNNQEVFLDGVGWKDSDGVSYTPIGSVETLSGMRKVETAYNNLTIKNGKYNYDRLEIEYNAPRQLKVGLSTPVSPVSIQMAGRVIANVGTYGDGCFIIPNSPASIGAAYLSGQAGSGFMTLLGAAPSSRSYITWEWNTSPYANIKQFFGPIQPLAVFTEWPSGGPDSWSVYGQPGVCGGSYITTGDYVVVFATGHGLTVGDNVVISGVGALDGGKVVSHVPDANSFMVAGTMAYDFVAGAGGTVAKGNTAFADYKSGWFYMGVSNGIAHEKESYFKGLIEGGRTLTLENLYDKASTVANIVPSSVSAAAWRYSTKTKLRKYFVRKPTYDDLLKSNAFLNSFPVNERGPTYLENVTRLSENLYALDVLISRVSARYANAVDTASIASFVAGIEQGTTL